MFEWPVAEKLKEYYHSLSAITMIPRIIGTIILVTGVIMTVGLLSLPISPMLIQAAEATTTTTTGVPECFGGPATIVGTDNDDVIEGTEGDDFIVGLGGNDRIYGKGGNERICGSDGDDRIYGNKGNDFVDGQNGRDPAFG
jgi:Ca2+-binding RTX toxin-like protein